MLAEIRASAFTGADPSRLALVNVAGSPAMSADTDAVAALLNSGRRLDGLQVVIKGAERVDDTPGQRGAGGITGMPAEGKVPSDTVTIAAHAEVSGYHQVEDDGTPVPGWLPAVTQDLVFVLRDDGGGWRIYAVHEPGNGER